MVVSFQFYGELNDFLPRRKRLSIINFDVKERASIKDTIEALGVPHPEVCSIEVNGEYVDFSYKMEIPLMFTQFPQYLKMPRLQALTLVHLKLFALSLMFT
jgi:hypothetical protein